MLSASKYIKYYWRNIDGLYSAFIVQTQEIVEWMLDEANDVLW